MKKSKSAGPASLTARKRRKPSASVRLRKPSPAFGTAITDDPDDAPELLDGFFEQAEIRDGDKIVRRGRPSLGDHAKVRIGLRLDRDIVEAYRRDGDGWQARINADLRKIRKLGKEM